MKKSEYSALSEYHGQVWPARRLLAKQVFTFFHIHLHTIRHYMYFSEIVAERVSEIRFSGIPEISRNMVLRKVEEGFSSYFAEICAHI